MYYARTRCEVKISHQQVVAHSRTSNGQKLLSQETVYPLPCGGVWNPSAEEPPNIPGASPSYYAIGCRHAHVSALSTVNPFYKRSEK